MPKKTKQPAWLELRFALVGLTLLVLAHFVSRLTDALSTPVNYTRTFGAVVLVAAILHACYRHTRVAKRRRLFHADGWATPHDFAHTLGRRAVRGKLGRYVRPSLATRAGRNGHRRRTTDYALRLGRCVTGYLSVRFRRVYSTFERCLIIIAPPGMGKTAMLLNFLMDAPGAVLAATTKTDLYDLTADLRRQDGPVHLFNPQNIGGIESTFGWDALIGCESYQEATNRAAALVHGTKAITGMAETSWGEKCVEILSKYLMAARLAKKDLHAVASWLANPANQDAVTILKNYPQFVPAGWAGALQAEMESQADRMKASIWSLARGAVAFMSNPLVARACTVSARDSFDATEFVRTRGTLYLIGDDTDETIAPLLNALTTYVHDAHKATATASPHARLDPPVGYLLDEVTKITPVPLNSWGADFRSFGGYVVAVTQSHDQIRERWGVYGAGQIFALFSKVILGGIQSPADLDELSKLAGTRVVQVVSEGDSQGQTGKSRSRNTTLRREPVLTPEDIRELPESHALVVAGRARAVVVKYKKGQVRARKELRKLHQLNRPVTSEAPPGGDLSRSPAGEPTESAAVP